MFHSRARSQLPPYRKGTLQELGPWALNEAESEAKDQRSWQRKFNDICNIPYGQKFGREFGELMKLLHLEEFTLVVRQVYAITIFIAKWLIWDRQR